MEHPNQYATPNPLPPSPNKFMEWLKNSLGIKLGILGFLILILLIPLAMVRSVIRERQELSSSVQYEVSSTFGHSQTFTGPVLTIPYTYYLTQNVDGKEIRQAYSKEIHFLPEILDIEADVQPEVKNRGIFSAILYHADLKVKGHFTPPDFKSFGITDDQISWDKARITVGLSDLRSIEEQVAIKWGDSTLALNPSSGVEGITASALGSAAPVRQGQEIPFQFDFAFGGSSSLRFSPMGKVTTLHMKSPWASPSFMGAFLPDDKTITDSSFTSDWKILHLNRPYPQQFSDVPSGIGDSDFGVSLLLPVNGYSQTERCVKYGALIITLTFMVFFFIQALTRKPVHSLQYLVVGFGLVLFYLLLVSISERMDFNSSYWIAASAIVGLITAYMAAIFRKLKLTVISFASLAGLYAFIFVLVQQEDYALLMGSIGLFVILALLMFLTRKMDWLKGKKE
jgi:inner membrane protein